MIKLKKRIDISELENYDFKKNEGYDDVEEVRYTEYTYQTSMNSYIHFYNDEVDIEAKSSDYHDNDRIFDKLVELVEDGFIEFIGE